MKLRLDGREITFTEEICYLDLLPTAKQDGLVAINIGGEYMRLNALVTQDADAHSVKIDNPEGKRVYERSLIFVMLMATRRVMPKSQVVIEHAIGSGIYVRLKDSSPIDILGVKQEMQSIIAQDLPFKKTTVDTKAAIDYYEKMGESDKVRLLNYRPFDWFDLYECGEGKGYFYGDMLPSTGFISAYDLIEVEQGAILILPDSSDIAKVSPFVHMPKLSKAHIAAEQWGDMMHCASAADLNDIIASGRIKEMIWICEARHERELVGIANEINHRAHASEHHAVLISGPSSSGKTTFTNRLALQLKSMGIRPMLLSIDDYYRDVGDPLTPVDENGESDLEHIQALDIDRFNQDIHDLMHGHEVLLPRYNFNTGKREDGQRVRLQAQQPLLIEGIHALNPLLTQSIDASDLYKAYVTALTQLNLDDHNRIASHSVRLMRRLVRDHYTRNTPLNETFARWSSVRRGEERWIFPYQEEADVIFNSSLSYEIAVLRKYLNPLLFTITRQMDCYSQARTLLKFLNYFLACEEDDIPRLSILREFVGGCGFYQ